MSSMSDAAKALGAIGDALSDSQHAAAKAAGRIISAMAMGAEGMAGAAVGADPGKVVAAIVGGALIAAACPPSAAAAALLAAPAIAALPPVAAGIAAAALLATGYLVAGALLEGSYQAGEDLSDDLAEILRNFRSDPMVLDLDGDGIELTALANSVTRFDLDEDGLDERTGWVGSHDGLLIHDANGNGAVDGVRELVGSLRVDGFDALTPLDTNGDKRVDALDPAFAALRIWRDADSNGVSEASELLTPEQAGIRSFNLAFTQVDRDLAGNMIARIGSYTRVDGTTRDMGSVLFALDQRTTIPEIPVGTDLRSLMALPNFLGSANVPDLLVAMALDPQLKAMVEALVEDEGSYATLRQFTSDAFEPMLFRWFGVSGTPPLGEEGRPLHARAIEALTGQFLPLNEFNARQLARLDEVWASTVDALAVYFLVQAVETPMERAYLEAGDAIVALDPDAHDFLSRFEAMLTALDADLAALPPPSGIRAPFALLSVDPATGDLTGDYNQFVQELLKDMPSYNPLGLYGRYDFNGVAVSEQWHRWYLDQGTFVFDVAAQMGLSQDYVMRATGWDWVLTNATNLTGTDGDDVLGRVTATGPATGTERLSGGDGNDTLHGNDAVDILIGGRGDDSLRGGSGSDMYVYASGDGYDRIIDGSGTEDTIYFSSELNSEDLRVSRITGTSDLMLHFGTPGQGIVLENQWNVTSPVIEQFHFVAEDGLDAGDIASLYLATLTTAGADTIIGSAAGERIYGGDGGDTLSGLSGDDVLDGGNGDDRIEGGWGGDTMRAGAGNDVLIAGPGNDTLVGGPGNDTLSGDGNEDTYVFNVGDGQDVLSEYSRTGSWGGNDRLELGIAIASGNVTIAQADSGRDLILSINGTTDRITINDTMVSGDHRLEQVFFSDGTMWTHADLVSRSMLNNAGHDTFYGSYNDEAMTGGAGNDVLIAREGNDTLIGGTGNDTLSGDGNDDTYVFNLGDGQDIVSEYSRGAGWGGVDTLLLGAGIMSDNISVSQADNGRDIVLSINGTTDRITVNDTMVSSDFRLEQVRFADGTTWTHADLVTRSMLNNTAADTFYGSYNGETLIGGAGNDVLIAREGNDTLIGGTGDDTLTGDGNDDTYVFSLGDGQDTITERAGGAGWGGTDTLLFGAGIVAGDISVSQADTGKDLVLSINGTSDRVTINETMVNGDYRLEQVRFADGTVWTHADLVSRSMLANGGADTFHGSYDGETLIGGAGNDTIKARDGHDTLIGGAGNDTLSGDGNDDTYTFNRGDGQDIISEYSRAAGYGGTDTLLFGAGIMSGDIAVSQADTGRDLVLSINGSTDRITINDTMVSGDYRLEQVRFADGTVWTHADLVSRSMLANAGNDTFYGSYDNDVLNGGAGNDTLRALAGNDTLIGGTGNDNLQGDTGIDVYHYQLGDGDDVIYDTSADSSPDEVLIFGAGITAADLIFIRSATDVDDVLVTFHHAAGSILLDEQMANAGVEIIRFADGSTLGEADFFAPPPAASAAWSEPMSDLQDEGVWGYLVPVHQAPEILSW